MKKFIILILILMFFIVSCSSSKKTENDTDILPDEDEISDEDAVELDKDITDVDENDEDNEDEPDESADTDEENPCDPNPCEGKENTTGECIVEEWHDNMGGVNYFSCVCDERYHSYYWNGWKCTNECEGDPCQYEDMPSLTVVLLPILRLHTNVTVRKVITGHILTVKKIMKRTEFYFYSNSLMIS